MRGVFGVVVVAVSLLAFARPAAAADPGFHSGWVSQSPWPTLAAGTTTSYTLAFRNTGTETWQRGIAGKQVNLGIVNDSLAFIALNVGWLSDNRVATTVEATVAPGAIGTFTFTMKAPLTAVSTTFRCGPSPTA